VSIRETRILSATESPEPSLPNPRRLRLDPNMAWSTIEALRPRFTNALTLSDEPNTMLSLTDAAAPNSVVPETDIEIPSLENPRTLKLEPKER